MHITFTIVATISSPFSYQSTWHMLLIAHYSSTISHVPGGFAAVLLLTWPAHTNLTITTPCPCLPNPMGGRPLCTVPWWWGPSCRYLIIGGWTTGDSSCPCRHWNGSWSSRLSTQGHTLSRTSRYCSTRRSCPGKRGAPTTRS